MLRIPHKCRICQNDSLKKFLSLGNLPLPNGFLKKSDLKNKEPVFPLSIGFCENCFLVQLLTVVNPDAMFRNYVYIPSTSQTRMNNFSQISAFAQEIIPFDRKSLVIDIGSNDGSLLSFFKGYGIRTLGIDPAANLARIAKLKGINTINDFISIPLAKKIVYEYGNANVVTATNVIAHIDNLHDFFSAIKILLSETGIFICEFPYLGDLIGKKLFDTIYHEHLSYFSLQPFLTLIINHDFKLIDLRRTDIDGGALRMAITNQNNLQPEASYEINQLLKLEQKLGLYKLETYTHFSSEIIKLKEDIRKTLIKLKKNKHSIVGYGASARGNILLSCCGIGRETIDFIVDSTPYKQGLYTPGHHIPILPEDALVRNQPDYTLITAWNFVKEIVDKQFEYSNRGGKFIIPVPKVEILKTNTNFRKKLKIVVIMPAYNAAKTIRDSYNKIPKKMIDEVILVDDVSSDNTFEIAKKLPLLAFRNKINLGYGGNLKVCLTIALKRGADIIIEYHPDDQYDPENIEIFIQKAIEGYEFALGSRFISPKEALKNNMPILKFAANRIMSFIDQLVLGIEMSEFHSGFRMYTKKLLEKVPFYQNSDNYLFSFEIIVQAVFWGFRVAEVPISCRYHPAMHTANFKNSTIYALGTFKTLIQYLQAKFFKHQRGPFLLIQPAPCPLCDQLLTRFEYVVTDVTSNNKFSIFFCSLCQVGFTVPVPKNLSLYYGQTYYSRLKTIAYRLLQNRRPKIIQRLVSNGKLLDIGSGDGNLSKQLNLNKYNYTGIETSFANIQNPLVKSIGIERMKEPPNFYDLVMFWESFEHLNAPFEVLKKAQMTLVRNGYLIIECPDFSSWERFLFGSCWYHLDPPRHLFHYTPKGIALLLETLGFSVIEQKNIYTLEYIPIGLAQSILYTLSSKLNIFNSKKDNLIFYISVTLLAVISILMIPISCLFFLLNGSPILLTIARKKST